MIGYKIYKDNMENYSEIALWCNENQATIVEREDYYEVIPVEPLIMSAEEVKQIREAELMHKLDIIKSAYAGAQLMKTDLTKLEQEYKATVDELNQLQKGKVD